MKLSANDIESLAQLAQEAAQKAADYIESQVHRTHKINRKEGVESLATQVVTAIDLKSQQLVLDHLKSSITQYDLGLLTEEAMDDGSRFSKDYFWCIDPLDGTLPFTEKKTGYAVSIALISQSGKPIIGVVNDPYHRVYWLAIKGKGVLKNNEPMKPLQSSQSLVCQVDRSFLQSDTYDQTLKGLQILCESLGYEDLQIRSGYGAVMNAMSLLDTTAGCYVKWPKPSKGGGCIWDFAATTLIYEELKLPASTANGDSIALNEQNPFMNQHGVIYATDKRLHQSLIRIGKQINPYKKND